MADDDDEWLASMPSVAGDAGRIRRLSESSLPVDDDLFENAMRWSESGSLHAMSPTSARRPHETADDYLCRHQALNAQRRLERRRPTPPGWAQPFIMAAYMIAWPIRAAWRRIFRGRHR